MTKKTAILVAACVLVAVLFIFDLQSSRELVPAIAYVVPVALSSLAYSARWTLLLIGLSLLATVGAGLENGLSAGFALDAVLNRVLAVLSFLLVGVFVLVLGRTSDRVGRLEHEEVRADREADLRHLLTDLSHHDTPHALLENAAGALPRQFGACKVVITAVRGGKIGAPHYSSAPLGQGDLCEGRSVPWVAALPVAGTRVASARLDGRLLTAGWLRRSEQDDLLVLVAGATVEEPCKLLGEVLDGLEPLLEHAERLEDRIWTRPSPFSLT